MGLKPKVLRGRRLAAGRVSVDRLEAALRKVAFLVSRDPIYTPIFERLESELKKANQTIESLSDAQKRAMRLLDQHSDRDRSEKTSRALK